MGSAPKMPAPPPAEPPIRNPIQDTSDADRRDRAKRRKQGLAGTLFAGQNTGRTDNEGQQRARPGRSLLQGE